MNVFMQRVIACGDKAEALRKDRRWSEAAAAYDDLAKAWIAAAGAATSEGARAERLAEAEKARSNADSLRSKTEKAPATAGGDGHPDRTAPGADDSDGEPPEEAEPLDSLLKQLDALVGLDGVKGQVHSMIDLIKYREKRAAKNLSNPEMSYHLVFTGNPGTGKTTVARLISKIYRSIGLLKRGQLVETDRSGLVAGYVGHTALKTKEVVEKALGGVLFIDEAYALAPAEGASGNDFGPEAIEALLKEMEDHRDNLLVIVAGYPDLMDHFIRHTNPGLPSRFPTTIHFEDYSADDLVRIFARIAEKNDYRPTEECLQAIKKHYRKVLSARPRDFANARDARNLFESAVVRQAHRLLAADDPTVEQLRTLTADDLPEINK